MLENIIVGLIAGITSLLVAIFTQYFIVWQERKASKHDERKKIQLNYLNPLRLFLIENHFRLTEIKRRIEESEESKCNPLLFIENSLEIKEKDDHWFNEEGCYLVSSCYLTACLFACLNRAREAIPFLELSESDDTKLLALSTKVSLGFLRDFGVFYVSQFSIGHDLYSRKENRILTYREFCSLIRNDNAAWFNRLFDYYLQTGKGEKLNRVNEALIAMKELSNFLDIAVGGGESLEQRYLTEGISTL